MGEQHSKQSQYYVATHIWKAAFGWCSLPKEGKTIVNPTIHEGDDSRGNEDDPITRVHELAFTYEDMFGRLVLYKGYKKAA